MNKVAAAKGAKVKKNSPEGQDKQIATLKEKLASEKEQSAEHKKS